METRDMDMLHGPLTGKLLRFTLPIALSSVVQQLFNAADTSVVGYFGDANALAAVGTNGEIVALIVTLSAGLAIGANILAAKKIGKGQSAELPAVAGTALSLAVMVGLPGLLLGLWAAGPLLRLIRTPDAIFPAALGYLRLYLLGYPFLLVYDFGAALLRARGDSRYPFAALAASGVVNVLLNLLFVALFRMGVAGVAIATDMSTALSALLVLRRLHRDSAYRFRVRSPETRYTGEILRQGIPSALQGAVFCFANIFVQASVNTFGPEAIAGSTIAMNFEYVTYYVITAFGQTATTFVGQNHAAGNLDRCLNILWLCLGLSVGCSLVLIESIVLFRVPLSGLFSRDPAVIQMACVRILCILAFEPVCCLYEIPAGVLRGAGHPALPAASTMVGTCLFRITWIGTVFRLHRSLPMLYYAFPLSWAATIFLVLLCFAVVRHKPGR